MGFASRLAQPVPSDSEKDRVVGDFRLCGGLSVASLHKGLDLFRERPHQNTSS